MNIYIGLRVYPARERGVVDPASELDLARCCGGGGGGGYVTKNYETRFINRFINLRYTTFHKSGTPEKVVGVGRNPGSF